MDLKIPRAKMGPNGAVLQIPLKTLPTLKRKAQVQDSMFR